MGAHYTKEELSIVYNLYCTTQGRSRDVVEKLTRFNIVATKLRIRQLAYRGHWQIDRTLFQSHGVLFPYDQRHKLAPLKQTFGFMQDSDYIKPIDYVAKTQNNRYAYPYSSKGSNHHYKYKRDSATLEAIYNAPPILIAATKDSLNYIKVGDICEELLTGKNQLKSLYEVFVLDGGHSIIQYWKVFGTLDAVGFIQRKVNLMGLYHKDIFFEEAFSYRKLHPMEEKLLAIINSLPEEMRNPPQTNPLSNTSFAN